jgi:hypothetical protein
MEECRRARIGLPETARGHLLAQGSQKSGQRMLDLPSRESRTFRTLSNQATWFNRLGAFPGLAAIILMDGAVFLRRTVRSPSFARLNVLHYLSSETPGRNKTSG